jgi:perosamine synthetase
VGVSSGTAGLHLAVRVLGLGPGDEAITTPFSFIASANCLLFEGVRPIFADIDPDLFTLDLDAARAAVNPRTRAVLPVHVFGNPVNMNEIREIARDSQLSIIEDACEAVGGWFCGRALGTWGDFGVFGFYPNKQMTTGEGGMVVTPRADWAERLRSLRNQGRAPVAGGSFVELGYNYRLSEIAAALGEGQLSHLDNLISARRKREERYLNLLDGLSELRVPPVPAGRSPFVFIIQASSGELRDWIREYLTSVGIQTAVYFRPIHLETFYREKFGLREGQFPRAEHAGRTCLAIPFHSAITDSEQVEVAAAIRDSLGFWLKRKMAPVEWAGVEA